MLVDLKCPREWSTGLTSFFQISRQTLPLIQSSSDIYGHIHSGLLLSGVAIAGCLGDQQAALVGQKCFKRGDAKNTYGTGCFMLYNTGETLIQSKHGLLTTMAYQFGDKAKPVYALEGAISVAGSAVQWLRDSLKIIPDAVTASTLAENVPNSGDVYFVTAFNGLFAPYWREDARGTIVGLTRYSTQAHIVRAALEATCFQTRAILDVMNIESGVRMRHLRVDGGMTQSDVTMQMQADLLGIPIHRPEMKETTALGAAIAAGLAVGIWKDLTEVCEKVNSTDFRVYEPSMSEKGNILSLKF